MKLLSLHIENFGRLSDFDYRFSSGLNEIRAENGYGKTTLSAFIKAMFYGLPDNRKRDLFENERSRYLPWQGGVCGGSLTFEAGGKRYRVERTFGQKVAGDTFTLYDLDLGRPSDDYTENLGRELFGIDADGYERTVFLSERNLSGKNENQTVAEKLSDLVGSTGDIGAYDEAVKRIEEKRRALQKKGGAGEIADDQKRSGQIDVTLGELKALEGVIADDKNVMKSLQSEADALERERAELEKKRQAVLREEQKNAIRRQLDTMMENRNREFARAAELSRFFASGEPEEEELSAITAKESERQRLTNRANAPPKSRGEYDVFRDLSEETIARMRSVASEIRKADARVADLKEKSAPKPPKAGAALLAFGILLILLGAVLGALLHPACFALILPGLILLLLLPIRGGRYQKAKGEWESAIREAERVRQEKADVFAALTRPYPHPACDDPCDEVNAIERRYDLARMMGEDARSENEEQLRAEAARLTEEIERFYRRFPLNPGGDRMAQIRRAKSEYDLCRRTIDRMQGDIDRFAAENGVSLKDKTAPAPSGGEDLAEKLRENQTARLALERRRAEIAAKIRSEEERMEERDALIAEKAALDESVAGKKRELNILQKTKYWLERAKESLTSKYLDGTKKAFLGYLAAISDESADFEMDTSFTVAKTDRGATRPVEGYSLGTRDLYALAARLALVDSLYREESPVILLDDPFAHFDDEKLARAIRLLQDLAKSRQIIYLTCSSARSAK